MEPESPQVIAIVLAGGDRSDPVARAAGVSSKAIAPFQGKPMVSYVLAALAGSRSVSHTVLVGEGLDALEDDCIVTVPAGRGLAHSLALGAGAALALMPGSAMLIVSADVPWLTSEAVDRFVVAAADLDLAYPIVPEGAAVAAFPTQRRTYVRLKQGRFTGGNMLLLRPRLAASLLELLDAVYRARKNPVALAGLIGPGTLVALLTGRAHLPRLERLVSARLGGRAGAIITADACVAADVDRAEQFDTPTGAEVHS